MANPTTNFNWQMPTNTDLVKDLPADFEVFGQAVDTSLMDLKGGTTGQILSKASNTDMDFTWVTTDDANAIQNAIVDAKGDLIAASAADTPARLAVGANNTYLIADSTQSTGLAWATGSYSTYTPGSITGFTQGNGTVDARYRQFGKTVDFSIKIVLGSTSSMTGSLTIQFPVSANTANNGAYIGDVRFEDSGVASYFGRIYQTGTNFMIAMVEKTDGTYNSQATTSATVPFTWGTNDAIYLMGSYEAA